MAGERYSLVVQAGLWYGVRLEVSVDMECEMLKFVTIGAAVTFAVFATTYGPALAKYVGF
jgi:hypothetical protein